ncbi:MAG: CorA family divalent cation transporter, partial [Phycisphaerales bacterium]
MVNQPPGTVTPSPDAPHPVLTVLAYGPDQFEERTIASPAEVKAFCARLPVVWLDVAGLGDAETIRQIGEIFGIHPLAQEDIVDTTQRPKLDPYGDRLFIVLRTA